jgi:GntR family transcriptional regulator, rspAB operon transcriptional repressor
MPLAPLRKKRATDEVYEALRAAILTRLFLPGQRLLSEDLSRQLGVSLTPIRHALSQLAVEGLIEVHPRSGTYVASISVEEVEETFEIRAALEALAATRAAKRVTDADLLRFDALLNSLAQPVRTEEERRLHESANLDFHRKILEIAGSKKLLEIYESLHAHIQIARIHASEGANFAALKPRFDQEQREHEAVVAALRQRSASKLQAALREHIGRAEESLLGALRTSLERPAHKEAKQQKAKRMQNAH